MDKSYRWIGCALAASLAILAGCDQQKMIEKFASPEDRATVQAYFQDLEEGRYQAIVGDLDPKLKSGDIGSTLIRMASAIPNTKPLSVKLVGAVSGERNGHRQSSLTYEYQYPDRWLIFSVVLDGTGKDMRVLGMDIEPHKQSLEDIYAFRLAGQPASHLVMLACCILFPLFSLFALVVCIRTPGVKRKWVWIVFILFGFCNLSLNWTTGAWTVSPIYFQLLSAGFFKPLYGPLSLGCALPVGAVWFLVRRKRLSRPVQPPVDSASVG